MAIIDKIQLSGTVYTIGNETTTAVTSASTDNEIPTAKAVYDAIPQGGGGKAIEAGRGISITTGETSDTVSLNIPISAGTGTNALIYNSTTNSANGSSSHAEGYSTTASGYYAHAEGYIANAKGYASHAEGLSTKSKGFGSHAEGRETEANGDYSHSEGYLTRTTNESEHSSGKYNNSVSASKTFGDSGNTLFSVGNGTSESARHNAFEIRQNGDIYISKDGQDVKLQDQLGGGSITIDPSLDSGSTNPVANSAITTAINEKQNKLTASRGISINQYQNTIFLDVPIYKAKDFRSCFVGDNPNSPNIVSGRYSFAVGLNNNVTGDYSLAVGGLDSYGEGNSATTINTFAFGRGNIAKSFCSTVVGYHNSSSNEYETDFGIYNNSVSASTTFGDSGNTLFSVGNGTNNARHNAFEIRQNGDIYISKDGQDVKLQDQLGGGGGTVDTEITSASTNPVTSAAIYNQFGGLKLVKLTQSEYDSLTTKDNSTLYVIVN